jgi:hypothetical protein
LKRIVEKNSNKESDTTFNRDKKGISQKASEHIGTKAIQYQARCPNGKVSK